MASLIRRKDPGQAWETEVDTGGGGSQPATIIQDSAPTQGTNAYYLISGNPVASWTATFRGQTTDPIAADATCQEICDALSLLSTAHDSFIPYPGTESETLDSDAAYVVCVRSLGAQPVEAFTVSDPAITVGGDDRTGVLPSPAGEDGQYLIDTDNALIPVSYQFIPALNAAQGSIVWYPVNPQTRIFKSNGTDFTDRRADTNTTYDRVVIGGVERALITTNESGIDFIFFDGSHAVVSQLAFDINGLLSISGGILAVLPTSNPGANLLWNDGGTVKVGT